MPLLMCPNCNASMTEVKRNDVAFDMCPTCRGVWLDRGELDKIIERSSADVAPAHAPAAAGAYPSPHYQHGYKKRRKSFLEELFD